MLGARDGKKVSVNLIDQITSHPPLLRPGHSFPPPPNIDTMTTPWNQKIQALRALVLSSPTMPPPTTSSSSSTVTLPLAASASTPPPPLRRLSHEQMEGVQKLVRDTLEQSGLDTTVETKANSRIASAVAAAVARAVNIHLEESKTISSSSSSSSSATVDRKCSKCDTAERANVLLRQDNQDLEHECFELQQSMHMTSKIIEHMKEESKKRQDEQQRHIAVLKHRLSVAAVSVLSPTKEHNYHAEVQSVLPLSSLSPPSPSAATPSLQETAYKGNTASTTTATTPSSGGRGRSNSTTSQRSTSTRASRVSRTSSSTNSSAAKVGVHMSTSDMAKVRRSIRSAILHLAKNTATGTFTFLLNTIVFYCVQLCTCQFY